MHVELKLERPPRVQPADASGGSDRNDEGGSRLPGERGPAAQLPCVRPPGQPVPPSRRVGPQLPPLGGIGAHLAVRRDCRHHAFPLIRPKTAEPGPRRDFCRRGHKHMESAIIWLAASIWTHEWQSAPRLNAFSFKTLPPTLFDSKR